MTKLDIEIRNGVDKIYGIADLPEKQRNQKHRMYMYSAGKNIQADNAKAHLLRWLKETKFAQQFVREIPYLPIRTIASKYHMNWLLIFKNDKRIKDMIEEVLDRAKLKVVEPCGYNRWKEAYDSMSHPKWKNLPIHPQPKNLTSGKQPFKEVSETILCGKDDLRVPELIKDPTLHPIRFGNWINFVSTRWERRNSEVGQFALKVQKVNHMTSTQYLTRLENHKMEKWVRKHPKPTNAQLKQDLFPDLMNAEWNTREHNAREFIRNNIRAKYDKTNLPVIGRFECYDGKFEERIIGYVRDYTHLADKINNDYYGDDMNPILKKAYEIFDAYYEHHPNMTNGYIQNAEKTIGRVLIPKHNACLQLTLGGGTNIVMSPTFYRAA